MLTTRLSPLRLLPLLLLAAFSCTSSNRPDGGEAAAAEGRMSAPDPPADRNPTTEESPATALATFGGGCFWCTEAVLEQLDGVLDVRSGYMGGDVEQPTYQQVCTGTTNHAEVVQVTFDPRRISYETLLDWFFRSHDPTTLNRQGADVGTQYRSVVFWHSEEQRQQAEDFVARIAPNWNAPIVTEISPAQTFWEAEAYHQDYYRNNPGQGYCRVVIKPKLEKLHLDTGDGKPRDK
ncbi:MAG TPA: peptide-methionine (S)-S-oxide reductase [bacterium]|nr:peptide-methionine (S)-S-oxide reductase [bacterium]